MRTNLFYLYFLTYMVICYQDQSPPGRETFKKFVYAFFQQVYVFGWFEFLLMHSAEGRN